MRRNLHRHLTVAAVAVLLAAAACTTNSNTSSTSSTASTTAVDDPRTASSPPISDGLVVPEGAEMVGSLFAPATYADDGERRVIDGSWLAHLEVTGDGFEVFDDLAAQVRELDAAMPGTADSCIWSIDEARSAEITGPGDLLVRGDPPPGTLGVRCQGWASNERGQRFWISMIAGHDAPMIVEIAASAVPPGPGEPDSYAKRILREGTSGDPALLDDLGPDPVPAGVWDAADFESPTPVEVTTGEPFGIGANCTPSGQFTLPAGASVLVNLFGDDLTTLLAVDDAEAVMDDLLAQAEPDDPSVNATLSTVEVDGDRQVLVMDTHVLAGGGSCTATTSPDGRTIRLDRFPD